MSLNVKVLNSFDEKGAGRISRFLDNACNATIFHYPQFLSYHGNRFANSETFLSWQKGDQNFAVMPAALFSEGSRRILRSPYGASFGGIVSKQALKLKDAIAVVDGLIDFCEKESVDEVIMTFPPQIYFSKSNDALFFALERAGFSLKSRDVFSVVDIGSGYDDAWMSYEGRARTAVRKSSHDFEIRPDAAVEEFYSILIEDKSRLDSVPTHSLSELLKIKANVPDSVWADVATHKDTGAKAGICYFSMSDDVVMTFYMAQETAALKLNGVNVLVDYGIKRAVEKGYRFFDFGGSTVGYDVQNIGVANFKESFGAVSSSRVTYEWRRGDE